jgi:hypothetical protein
MASSMDGGLTPPRAGMPRADSAGADIVETYDVVGQRVAVGATPGKALSAVRTLLRGFGPPVNGSIDAAARYDLTLTMGGWHVRAANELIHTSKDFAPAITTLEFRIVTDALLQRNDVFRLHAAAVCLPLQSGGVVVAGDSGCGKTTLTLALMLRGFVAFTDDVALIEPDSLSLLPFRRAFHVDSTTWKLLEPLAGRPLNVEESFAGYFTPPQWAEQSAPVRVVLFPELQPQVRPQLTPLSPADAATLILTHATSLMHAPQRALATAAQLVERARCYRFIVGDLAASVAAVERFLAS